MIKTRVNFKPFSEEISQKFDCLHIYDLNLLKFIFSIFNLIFSNIYHKSGKDMIKTRSNFKLCGEDIIPKFDRLIAPYSFTAVSNQTNLSFLTTHNPQLFSQLTIAFFITTTKPNRPLI
jgi:hypothetical protein